LTYQDSWGHPSHGTNPHKTFSFNSLPIYNLFFSSTGGGSFGPQKGPLSRTNCVSTNIRSECMDYHRSRWNHVSMPVNKNDIYMIKIGDNIKIDPGSNHNSGAATGSLKGKKSNVLASDYANLKNGFGHNYIQSNHIWGSYSFDNWTWDRNGDQRWEDPRYRHQKNTTISEIGEGGEVSTNFLWLIRKVCV
jgi:hypothetical protein